MKESMHSPIARAKVRKAAMLILTYATAVLIGTGVHAVATDFEDRRLIFRGLLRVAGMGYVAFWLKQFKNAAWWAAIIASTSLALVAIFAIVGFSIAGSLYGIPVFTIVAGMIMPAYCLSHASILLIDKDVRALFHKGGG